MAERMSKPQAYAPEPGQRFQILCQHPDFGRSFEHCDYAKDKQELQHLLDNYRMAYGPGWRFKTITLPRRFWPAKEKT